MIIIAIVATVRSVLFPFGDESIPNTSTPVGDLLQSVQASFPVLSVVGWGFLLFFAALDAGRYGPKYALYPAYTLMAIPVFGPLIVAAGSFLGTLIGKLKTVCTVVTILQNQIGIQFRVCVIRIIPYDKAGVQHQLPMLRLFILIRHVVVVLRELRI